MENRISESANTDIRDKREASGEPRSRRLTALALLTFLAGAVTGAGLLFAAERLSQGLSDRRAEASLKAANEEKLERVEARVNELEREKEARAAKAKEILEGITEAELTAYGVKEETPDIFWGVDADGVLYIGGEGEVDDLWGWELLENEAAGKAVPAEIKKGVVLDGITKLDRAVFANLPQLKEVELSRTVTDVADMAFYECGALERIVLRGSRTALYPECFVNCAEVVRVDTQTEAWASKLE